MNGLKRIFLTSAAAIMLLAILLGFPHNTIAAEAAFTSFRDIPGVTAEEIAAIEALQSKGEPFVYAALETGEAFEHDGHIYGFAAEYCSLMTELFNIEFQPQIYEWDEILLGLETGDIDFTGELKATDERRDAGYFMTGPIATRSIIYTQRAGDAPLTDIASLQTPRFAFLRDALTAGDVASHLSCEFETVFVDDAIDAYVLLESGEIDAFFNEGGSDKDMVSYSDFVVRYFFPVISSPVSMTTQNTTLAPIISVVQKALQHEGFRQHRISGRTVSPRRDRGKQASLCSPAHTGGKSVYR